MKWKPDDCARFQLKDDNGNRFVSCVTVKSWGRTPWTPRQAGTD